MIHINGLNFSYQQKNPLFDQLDLDLPAGHIYGLLGRNGAGKSTLLKIISGLLFPAGGDVEVYGYTPKDRLPSFLSDLYMISEEFELPDMVLDRYVHLYSCFYPDFDHDQLQGYLDEFNLSTRSRLSSFSYGQKKKFLLSFGLAANTKILVMDEPTNGLDIPSKSQFRKIVASAIHEDRTILISTHQARDMEHLIDPIIIMDEGKVVFFEDYEQISSRLTVTRQKELIEDEGVVYTESNFNGYTVVKENQSAEETNLNLELLFNAVLSNQHKMREIFNRGI